MYNSFRMQISNCNIFFVVKTGSICHRQVVSIIINMLHCNHFEVCLRKYYSFYQYCHQNELYFEIDMSNLFKSNLIKIIVLLFSGTNCLAMMRFACLILFCVWFLNYGDCIRE